MFRRALQKKIIIRFIKVIFLACVIFSMQPISYFGVNAETSAEIQERINAKQKELDALNKALKSAQADLNRLSGESSKNQNDLSSVQKELDRVNLEININTGLRQQIELSQNIKDLELDQKEAERKIRLISLYKNSRNFTSFDVMVESKDLSNLEYKIKYSKQIVNKELEEIKALNSFISDLVIQKDEMDKKISSLQSDNNNLNNTKLELENRIAALKNQIASASSKKNQYASQISGIQDTIGQLTEEHKKLLEAEIAAMNANPQHQQIDLKPGDYFWQGRGRDLYEGHGLGMSQWGAFGMAQKGWTYDQILKFYYTGVTIGDYKEPDSVIVDGGSPMSVDTYLAGIGEVPNSWPAEVIKAQVVAARTYMMGTCKGNNICRICGNANCQVYNGGTGKMSYVLATKGKVILYNNQPIVAYYSASHRGYSSSISNVWGGTDKPYIKPVNDDAYAYKDYWVPDPYHAGQKIKSYNWIWRTNGYTMEEISAVLAKDSRTNVGQLQRVDITRDVSKRVGKITLIGSSGTKTLTGWNFKAIYNSHAAGDYIYSTEFYLNKVD